MKESIGGGWLFGIVIVFIFLFAGFLAYSISYTKAFNVKNEVINYIEQKSGYTPYTKGNLLNETNEEVLKSTTAGKIKLLIDKSGYNVGTVPSSCPDKAIKEMRDNFGICIVKYCPTGDKKSDTHYKVTTYIHLTIPVIEIGLNIPISGETTTIYTDVGDRSVDCISGVSGG